MTKEEITSTLNESQKMACTSIEGNIRLVAGAGSGKTNTLTKRIAYICEDKRIDPSRILCITFTNKAANEMKERAAAMLGVSEDSLSIGTFHRLAMDIVEEDAKDHLAWLSDPVVGSTPVKFAVQDYLRDNADKMAGVSEEDKAFLLEVLTRYCESMMNGNYEANMLDNNQPLPEMCDVQELLAYEKEKTEKLKLVESARGKLARREKKVKDGKATVTDLNEIEELKKVIEENKHEHQENSPSSTWAAGIIRYKMSYGMLNFDELISVALYLLKEYPDVREKWQDKFDYVQVDEFQDTDELQFEIAKILTERNGNLFVVGDADQSIYGFRGTSSELFVHFEEHLERPVTTIEMTKNYRSVAGVLEVANEVIKLDETRMPKDLVSQKDGDATLGIITSDEAGTYAKKVADKIEALIAEGTKPEEIAVLFRNTTDKIPIEIYNELRGRGIVMDTTLNTGKVVEKYTQMAFDLIRYKETGNICYFHSFIGNLSKDQLTTYDELKERFTSKVDAIDDVLDDMDYIQILDEFTTPSYTKEGAPKGNYKSYVESKEAIASSVCNLVTNWGRLTDEEKEAMYRPDAKPDNQTEEEKAGVKLMTMHKSKGLEFENVFVCGLDSKTKDLIKYNDAEKNEECRLHYVAYSRAKENLYIVEESMENASIFTKKVEDLMTGKSKVQEDDYDDDFEIE